jgi:hypothetical protein
MCVACALTFRREMKYGKILKTGILMVILVFMVMNIVTGKIHERSYSKKEKETFLKDLNEIERFSLKNESLLVKSGSVYKYYLGRGNIKALENPYKTNMKFVLRHDYLKKDISVDLMSHKYTAVFLPKDREYDPFGKQLEVWGYRKIDYSGDLILYKSDNELSRQGN